MTGLYINDIIFFRLPKHSALSIIGGTLSKGVLVDESLPLVWINNQHEGYTPLWLLLTSFSYSVPLCMPTLECLPLFLYQSLSGPAVFNEKTRKKVKHRVATGNTAHKSTNENGWVNARATGLRRFVFCRL